MNKKILSEVKEKIHRYVAARRLREAFSTARSLAETMMDFECADALQRAEDTYRHMLHYAATGAEDPSRADMTAQLSDTILSVTDILERGNFMADDSSLYYNVARFEKMRPQETVGVLMERYLKLSGDTSLFNLVAGSRSREEYRNTLVSRQELERRIFNRIWTSHPLSAADASVLDSFFAGQEAPEHFKALCVWALTLGQLSFFDARRIELLLGAYMNGSPQLRAAAITGLLLSLSAARGRYIPKRVIDRLESARETDTWQSDLELAYKEFVRTRDTDRITAKIRDEVVPEMMKLRPEISRRFSGELPLDPAEMEENPQWHELLDKSGVTDKLKEMSEIQEDGGDVMMGTFSHLKSFPFFHEVANWFLPFHTDRSELEEGDSGPIKALADILMAMPMLCDSDKYSMLLSLQAAPEAQRSLLVRQINAQAEQFAGLRAAMLNTDLTDRRDLVRKQVQNLFRFFRLYRRKGEFPNPFDLGIDPAGVVGLESLCVPALSVVVAEFYFSHGYWHDGLKTARAIDGLQAAASVPDSPEYLLMQRMGFAAMKLGLYTEARDYFNHLLLVTPENPWVVKNAARCDMQLGLYDEALRLFLGLSRQPGYGEDANLALYIGHCYLETADYDKAVKAYFKAEYLGAKPRKVLRQLAWALLMNGDAAQARRYLERAMSSAGPVPNDYLNLGHIALSTGDFKEALNSYRLNIVSRREKDNLSEEDAREAFIADVRQDSAELSRLGISPDLLPLLVDSLFYTI